MIPDIVRRVHARGGSVIPQRWDVKRPAVEWKQFQEQPPTEEDLERWAKRKYGSWALICGAVSGIDVLDFDGPAGKALMKEWGLRPTVLTPHDGAHVWIEHPGFRCTKGVLRDGCELKCEGATATFVGEGRRVVAAAVRKWKSLPSDLKQLVNERRYAPGPQEDAPLPDGFDKFLPRNEILEEALDKIEDGLPRNEAGFWLACQLRDERYDDESAARVMRRFVKRVNANGKHLYRPQEAYDTLRSAYSQPARLPRFLASESSVAQELRRLIDREKAKLAYRSMTIGMVEVESLSGVQDMPKQVFTIHNLQPMNSNVLLSGERKVGKTKFILNLAKSLLDDRMFLGRFEVEPLTGCLGYFNYEMSAHQLNDWLKSINIDEHHRFIQYPLRGKHIDIYDDQVFKYVAETLKRDGIEYLVCDPWQRMIAGLAGENDNEEVAMFLERLEQLKGASGIRDLLIVAHIGKSWVKEGLERSRGASSLEGWADALWYLTRDGPQRFLRAEGRDVDVMSGGIDYEEDSGGMVFGGESKREMGIERLIREALAVVESRPGIKRGELVKELVGKKERKEQAVSALAERGLVRIKRGPGHVVRYHVL